MPKLKNQAYNKYAWTILNQTVKELTVACTLNNIVMFTLTWQTNTIDANDIESRIIKELQTRGL